MSHYRPHCNSHCYMKKPFASLGDAAEDRLGGLRPDPPGRVLPAAPGLEDTCVSDEEEDRKPPARPSSSHHDTTSYALDDFLTWCEPEANSADVDEAEDSQGDFADETSVQSIAEKLVPLESCAWSIAHSADTKTATELPLAQEIAAEERGNRPPRWWRPDAKMAKLETTTKSMSDDTEDTAIYAGYACDYHSRSLDDKKDGSDRAPAAVPGAWACVNSPIFRTDRGDKPLGQWMHSERQYGVGAFRVAGLSRQDSDSSLNSQAMSLVGASADRWRDSGPVATVVETIDALPAVCVPPDPHRARVITHSIALVQTLRMVLEESSHQAVNLEFLRTMLDLCRQNQNELLKLDDTNDLNVLENLDSAMRAGEDAMKSHPVLPQSTEIVDAHSTVVETTVDPDDPEPWVNVNQSEDESSTEQPCQEETSTAKETSTEDDDWVNL